MHTLPWLAVRTAELSTRAHVYAPAILGAHFASLDFAVLCCALLYSDSIAGSPLLCPASVSQRPTLSAQRGKSNSPFQTLEIINEACHA